MGLYKYLNRIRRLDAMIRRKCTGSPKELADKLDISERWLYIFLDELKEELGCPIQYDRYRRSYVYEEQGSIDFGFHREISKKEEEQVSGGRISKNLSHCMYLFSGGWLVTNEAIINSLNNNINKNTSECYG